MSLDRIEAELGGSQTSATAADTLYDKACLAIVALVAPEASASEQRSIARSIAAPAGPARETRLDRPDLDASFYGSAAAPSGPVARCGAAAVDVGSKL